MAVDHDRRSAWGLEPFSIDDGMACRRDNLGLEAQVCKLPMNEFGTPNEMWFTRRIGTDRGNPQEFLQFFNESIGIPVKKFRDLLVDRQDSVPSIYDSVYPWKNVFDVAVSIRGEEYIDPVSRGRTEKTCKAAIIIFWRFCRRCLSPARKIRYNNGYRNCSD